MKTTNLYFALIAIMGTLAFASCNKDDDDANVSMDDVSDAVEYSLTNTAEGLAATTDEAIHAYELAAVAKNGIADCGVNYDTTITRIGNTAAATYNYVYNIDYLLTCGVSDPISFAYNYAADGTYDLPRMASDDAAMAEWVLTGLDANSANYLLNGSYVRQGSQESKVRLKRKFSSTITYTLANISIDKTTGYINGGTATLTIAGSASSGGSFSFTGTATFTSTQVTVVLDGESYVYVL